MDKDHFNVYLVTARHVLQTNGKFHPLIFIRLNTKTGGSEIIPIQLDEKVPLYVHPETEVDIALFGCLPDQQKYDFMFLTDDLVARKETVLQNEIYEGDDVFFSGLFTSHIGQKRNQPIVRFGKVALMSDEKIEWKEKEHRSVCRRGRRGGLARGHSSKEAEKLRNPESEMHCISACQGGRVDDFLLVL